jgi:hypothetical protein
MARKRLGLLCSTGCRTRDHGSWGECIKAKNARIAYANSAGGSDYTAEKKWDAELNAYREARDQGIQPDGTTMPKIRAALEASDKKGAAYGRDFGVASPLKA